MTVGFYGWASLLLVGRIFFFRAGIKPNPSRTAEVNHPSGPYAMSISKTEFTHWIEEYHAALYRHALWMLGHAENAAEAVQEAYYQAWKARASLRDKSQAMSWLLTILRRCVYRQYATQKQEAVLVGEDEARLEQAGEETDNALLLDLGRGLRRLSPEQRDLILLHGLHGFSYEQISTQLEIPLGTVMSRLSRARKALREALESPSAEVISLAEARLRR